MGPPERICLDVYFMMGREERREGWREGARRDESKVEKANTVCVAIN